LAMAGLRYLENVVTLQLDVATCIGCGMCAAVCPHGVVEMRERQARLRDRDACIECGACSYVCPSHIPLVQYYRFAKSEIRANERDKVASNLARERHEFHLLRIEREKQEKADKLAQKEKTARAAKAAAAGIDTTAIDALRAQVLETARPDSEHPKE